MAAYQGLIPYAVQQAAPYVAHILHGVGQLFDVAGPWRSEAFYGVPAQEVYAAPRDVAVHQSHMDISIHGQTYLGEHVYAIDTYGIEPGRKGGVVKLSVTAYARFGVLRGASSQEEDVKYLYAWTDQYQTVHGTDVLLMGTTAGQLAFARGRTSRGCLAREIAEGIRHTSSQGVVLKVPLFWFSNAEGDHRFDSEKHPFGGLEARGTDGRAWVTDVDFSVGGRLANSLMRYNDRLVGRSDVVEFDLKHQVVWLPASLGGPAIPLHGLQIGE